MNIENDGWIPPSLLTMWRLHDSAILFVRMLEPNTETMFAFLTQNPLKCSINVWTLAWSSGSRPVAVHNQQLFELLRQNCELATERSPMFNVKHHFRARSMANATVSIFWKLPNKIYLRDNINFIIHQYDDNRFCKNNYYFSVLSVTLIKWNQQPLIFICSPKDERLADIMACS